VLGSVTTSVATLNLGAGSTGTISVTAYDTQNQVIANVSPAFSIGNAAVAEVNSSGQVLGLSAGSTQVTVSVSVGAVTRTATVTVTVSGVLPTSASVVASSGDFTFAPRDVAISRGGSVTWTFGTLEHNVNFLGGAGAPSSITSGYAASISRTFATAGNFSYNCTIHAGMSGQVIVR
jgi:plastocyanin